MGGALYFLPSQATWAGRQESFGWQKIASCDKRQSIHDVPLCSCSEVVGIPVDLRSGDSEDWGVPVASCCWFMSYICWNCEISQASGVSGWYRWVKPEDSLRTVLQPLDVKDQRIFTTPVSAASFKETMKKVSGHIKPRQSVVLQKF